MQTNRVVEGKRIYLRQLELNDCNEEYVKWMNDPDVVRYLEVKWNRQDILSIRDFVIQQRNNDHSFIFAIIKKDNNQHIGNIKIGPINNRYKHADISYFIGEKDEWNKGLTTEAIRLICEFGFRDINLHRIEAGAYDRAVGSWKALENNGFMREGVFREQVNYEGAYIDVYRYGLLHNEFV